MDRSRKYLTRATRNAAEILLYSGVQYALLICFSIAVGRTLGREGLGLFSYLTALTLPLWVATEFGIESYLIRELAAHPDRSRELCARTAALRLMFAIVVVACVIPVIALAQTTPTARWGIILLGAGFLPRSLYLNYLTALVARQHYFHARKWDILGAFVLLSGTVVILLTTHSILQIVALSASLDFMKLAVITPFYKKEFGESLFRLPRLRAAQVKEMAVVLLPFAGINVLTVLHARADILLLEHFRTTAEVGVYTAAERFINVSSVLPGALFYGLLPLFASLRGKSGDKEFSIQSFALFTGLGLVVSAAFWFAAPFAIMLTFRFAESVLVLRILAWSVVCYMFNSISESWLYAHHGERIVVVARIAAVTMVIGANVYLAPRYGAPGTAIATTLAEFCLAVVFGCVLFVKYKRYKTKVAGASTSIANETAGNAST